MNSKLSVSTNRNKTKEGVKVQFTFPQTIVGDQKAEITQKLQSKLQSGLGQYNLSINQDTDVPYENVIGFLIPIADFKLLIKKALGLDSADEADTAPVKEEPPQPPPIKESSDELGAGYTHFLIDKSNNKIVNGWDYSDTDKDEIPSWVKIDIKDQFPDRKPSEFKLVTRNFLVRNNMKPSDINNWLKTGESITN
jgi:hypothetical protein